MTLVPDTAAISTTSIVPDGAVSGAPIPYRLPNTDSDLEFARHVGIEFRDIRILRLALTHRSVLHDWLNVQDLDATLQSNERLEFLGDALLGVIVAEFLYHADNDADEGTLTRRRAATVRAETLVRWARDLRMQEFLYLGTGERVTESVRDRMLAGGYEALVGAIYLDRGQDVAERFVRGYLQRDISGIMATEEQTNPKGTLQEVMQERFGDPPEYETIAAEGPDHARQFTVAVVLNDEHIGIGRGRSKREAQQAAARKALETLGVTIGVERALEPETVFSNELAEVTTQPLPQSPMMPGQRVAHDRELANRRIRGAGRREG